MHDLSLFCMLFLYSVVTHVIFCVVDSNGICCSVRPTPSTSRTSLRAIVCTTKTPQKLEVLGGNWKGGNPYLDAKITTLHSRCLINRVKDHVNVYSFFVSIMGFQLENNSDIILYDEEGCTSSIHNSVSLQRR